MISHYISIRNRDYTLPAPIYSLSKRQAAQSGFPDERALGVIALLIGEPSPDLSRSCSKSFKSGAFWSLQVWAECWTRFRTQASLLHGECLRGVLFMKETMAGSASSSLQNEHKHKLTHDQATSRGMLTSPKVKAFLETEWYRVFHELTCSNQHPFLKSVSPFPHVTDNCDHVCQKLFQQEQIRMVLITVCWKRPERKTCGSLNGQKGRQNPSDSPLSHVVTF